MSALPGVVARTFDSAILEAEFLNGMGSVRVGGYSPSIVEWIL